MHGMSLYSYQPNNKPKFFGGSLETELHSFIKKFLREASFNSISSMLATADGTDVIVYLNVRIKVKFPNHKTESNNSHEFWVNYRCSKSSKTVSNASPKDILIRNRTLRSS